MGSEAYRHSCFDGAVSFYHALTNILRQNHLNNDIGFDRERSFRLSYGHAKSILRTLVRIHDNTLAEKGQFGPTHSCRSQPYIRSDNLELKPRNKHSNVRIISKTTLHSYKTNPETQRTKIHKEREMPTRVQANRLCLGQQLKVCDFLKFRKTCLIEILH